MAMSPFGDGSSLEPRKQSCRFAGADSCNFPSEVPGWSRNGLSALGGAFRAIVTVDNWLSGLFVVPIDPLSIQNPYPKPIRSASRAPLPAPKSLVAPFLGFFLVQVLCAVRLWVFSVYSGFREITPIVFRSVFPCPSALGAELYGLETRPAAPAECAVRLWVSQSIRGFER